MLQKAKIIRFRKLNAFFCFYFQIPLIFPSFFINFKHNFQFANTALKLTDKNHPPLLTFLLALLNFLCKCDKRHKHLLLSGATLYRDLEQPNFLSF